MVLHTRFLLWRWRDAVRDRILGRTHRTQVFDRIYRENLWGAEQSVSGRGSSLEATVGIREALSGLFARHGIDSLLDAPCGDFAWMRHVVQCLNEYQGVDIVPDLIKRNQLAYGSQTVRFTAWISRSTHCRGATWCCVGTALFTYPRGRSVRRLATSSRAAPRGCLQGTSLVRCITTSPWGVSVLWT